MAYKATIEKLKKQLSDIQESQRKMFDEEETIKNEITKETCKHIIESGILKEKVWRYRPDTCIKKDWVSFAVAQHDWQELSELISGGWYHYKFPVVKNEIAITGDDGDIYIHIKLDVLDKWLKKIHPVIDIAEIDEEIAEISKGIQKDLTAKENLIEMSNKFRKYYPVQGD